MNRGSMELNEHDDDPKLPLKSKAKQKISVSLRGLRQGVHRWRVSTSQTQQAGMQPMARAQLDEGVARAQFASLLNRFQGFSKVADKEQTVGISAQASATESSDREVCQSGLLRCASSAC